MHPKTRHSNALLGPRLVDSSPKAKLLYDQYVSSFFIGDFVAAERHFQQLQRVALTLQSDHAASNGTHADGANA
jgi:hypothetical protein